MKPGSSEPRFQREYGESCGLLLQVNKVEGFCIAIFPWGPISLPEELEDRLRELVGKKIGILRLDGYHFRELEE